MTDISKITLPDNTTYNIKDKNARNFTNTPYYEQDEEALMFQLGESYMTGEQDNQPYSFRAAGGSADIGNREYDKIVGGTVAWNQLVRNEASTNETDFADIVTVDDAVEDAAAVKVAIEPVQDLHGYDYPWPAGGGKNLIVPKDGSFSFLGMSCVCSTSAETISLEGTAIGSGGRNNKMTNNIVLPAGRYTISVTAVSGTKKASYIISRTDNNTYISSRSFSLEEATSIYVGANVTEGTVYNEVVHIQIEVGSVATEWTPYSNICPITGWDGVKVQRTGANLFDGEWEIGSINHYTGQNSTTSGNIRSKNYIAVKPGSTIYRSWDTAQSGSVYVLWMAYKADKSFSRYIPALVNPAGLTLKNDEYYLRFYVYNRTTALPQMMINYGKTAMEYVPYAGTTYSITLPSEAGMVYGGELTVNEDGTGTLVVDRAMVDLGTLDWTTGSSGRHSTTNMSNIKSVPNTQVFGALCSKYQSVSGNSIANEDKAIGLVNGYMLQINDSAYNGVDATEFKTAMDGVQFVYELATPINYTLTPTEIRTLLGTNNVWADAGQVSLSYTGTDEHLVLKSDKKYLTRISGTDSVLLGSGQEITAAKGTDNIFNLTQMLGTTIADYIYSLEQATSGAGVAWFRKLFPKPYYEYNPGELMSVQAVAHKLVGFNAWDEEWELGIINTTTGEETDSNSNIRSKNYIRVIPGATYYFKLGTTDISNNIVFYDAEKNYVAASGEHVNDIFTVPEDAHYMKFYMSTNYGRTYLSNICINLSGNGERDGEYEEYEMHSYPLDSSLVLRGLPKLDANNQLYYDGDVYEADGTVTRKYGIVDLGTLNWHFHSMYNIFYGMVTDVKNPKNNSELPNCVSSSEYTKASLNRFHVSSNDKIYGTGHPGFFANCVIIRDTSYSDSDSATFKAAMSGVMLLYELATPTTETAESYDNPQIVDPEGTEEYITTNIVFVGHETKY